MNEKRVVCTYEQCLYAEIVQIAHLKRQFSHAPARRKAELFLSRLDPLTTVEDILSHVKAYLKSNDVQCERLQTRYNSYVSFRVTVDNRFYKRMINADMWPEYVVFRRYFPPMNL